MEAKWTPTPGPWHFMEKLPASRDDHGYRTIATLLKKRDGAEFVIYAEASKMRQAGKGFVWGDPEADGPLLASAPTLAALLASTIEWCPVCKGTGIRTYIHRKQSKQQPCIVQSCIEARAVLKGLLTEGDL